MRAKPGAEDRAAALQAELGSELLSRLEKAVIQVAEAVRFELTEDSHPRQFSRLLHSTALPRFQARYFNRRQLRFLSKQRKTFAVRLQLRLRLFLMPRFRPAATLGRGWAPARQLSNKCMEHVYVKPGAKTRAAPAGIALMRIKQPYPQYKT